MSVGRLFDRLSGIFMGLVLIVALAPSLASAQDLDAIYFVCGFGALFIVVIVILVYLMVRALVRRVTNTVSSATYMVSKGVVDGILDTPPRHTAERPYREEHEHHEPEVVVKEVVKEIVKIPCEYCGTPVEVTATKCPSCGAPVTYGR